MERCVLFFSFFWLSDSQKIDSNCGLMNGLHWRSPPTPILTHKISHWPLAAMFRQLWSQSLHLRLYHRSWPVAAWRCFRQTSSALRRCQPHGARPEVFRLPPGGPAWCSGWCGSPRRPRSGSSCRTDSPPRPDPHCPAPGSCHPHRRPLRGTLASEHRCSGRRWLWCCVGRFHYHAGGLRTTHFQKAYDGAENG